MYMSLVYHVFTLVINHAHIAVASTMRITEHTVMKSDTKNALKKSIFSMPFV